MSRVVMGIPEAGRGDGARAAQRSGRAGMTHGRASDSRLTQTMDGG